MKDKWVAALRSGKYKQGSGVLRKGDLFCCLGVLCEIHPDVEWQGTHYEYDGIISNGWLPGRLYKDLGLSFSDEMDLSTMNDEGKTFEEIADYIENDL